MRKSRFTTEQIVGLLKQHEAGAKISELCRQNGISDNTFHRCKRKYGGLEVPDPRRLKQLEEQNSQLNRIVAHQALNLVVVKDLYMAADASNFTSSGPTCECSRVGVPIPTFFSRRCLIS